MNQYQLGKGGNGQVNRETIYVIGELNRGRGGWNVTKYGPGNVCRKMFPNERRLENFLEQENTNGGMKIVPAKIISKRTQTLVERLARKYC